MYDPLFAAWCRSRLSRSRGRAHAQLIEVDNQLLEACSPPQRQYALDPSRRFAGLTGRGAGKTTVAKVRLTRKAQRISRARLLFLATTKDQAEDLMWEPLKELLDRLSIRASFNETKLRCTLTDSRSLIWLVGADDKRTIEKLRGRPWHEVIVDEGASYKPALLANMIHRIIGPRLGDFGGVLGIQGTPGHVLNGLFYDVTRTNSDIGRLWADRTKPEFADFPWSVHKWTLLDQVAAGVRAAINLWAEALKVKAENKWGDRHPIWMREYLGIWAADETEMMYHYRPHTEDGEPWNEWKCEKRGNWAVLPPNPRDDWRYAIGMDLGHGTPFACQVAAISPTDQDRNIWQAFEFVKRGMYNKKIAELLIGEDAVRRGGAGKVPLAELGGIIGHLGRWPDHIVADDANLGDAILEDLAKTYGIPVKPAKKKDKPAVVELTNGDLGDGRAHIQKDSQLAQEMAELQWRVDEYGQLKEPKHGDNACDGWIYARRELAKSFRGEDKPKADVFAPARRGLQEGDDKPSTPDPFAGLLSNPTYEEAAWEWD